MLHERISPETLGCARIWVFGIWLVWVFFDPLSDLARYPADTLRPIGILKLVPATAWPLLLSPAGLWGIKLALLTGLAALALGLPGYRTGALLTCALLTLYQGLIRGLTFSNHSELAMLYATWVLALSPAADALAFRRRHPPGAAPAMYSAPMQLIALILLACYSLVGVRRLMESVPVIFFDDTIVHYLALRAAPGQAGLGDVGLAVLEHRWLAPLLGLGFAVVWVFETLAPLCLVSRWFRRAWLPVIVLFHLSTWALMGILFLFNLLMIPMFVTEVDRLLSRRQAGPRGPSLS